MMLHAVVALASLASRASGSARPPPRSRCSVTLEELCGSAQKRGTATCNNCLKTHWTQLERAGCSLKTTEAFCKGGGPPPPSPGGTYECWQDKCYAGKGTLSKAACYASCGSPLPPGGGYTCYDGTCYEKSGGTQTKAECEAKCAAPGPACGAAGDQLDTYTTKSGMTVKSVTGGTDGKADPYDKVVVMLHGGGGNGDYWKNLYCAGWLGVPGSADIRGVKYVFPTSPDSLWYISYKNGCGWNDCSYNLTDIGYKSDLVKELIDYEMSQPGIGNDGKKVFLAGYSQGAQMTGYMQLAKLSFALGGVAVFDGFPLPPLWDMRNAPQAAARANSTLDEGALLDTSWLIFQGTADPIFTEPETSTTWRQIFTALGANETLKCGPTNCGPVVCQPETSAPSVCVVNGMNHVVTQQELTAFRSLIRNGTV